MTGTRASASSPMAREVIGPMPEIAASSLGVRGSLSMAVTPPMKCRVIELAAIPKRRAISAWEISCSSSDSVSRIANATPATYLRTPRPGWTSSIRGARR